MFVRGNLDDINSVLVDRDGTKHEGEHHAEDAPPYTGEDTLAYGGVASRGTGDTVLAGKFNGALKPFKPASSRTNGS